MEGVLPAAGGAHQRGWLGAAIGTPCSRRSSSSVSGARPRAAAPRGRRSLATRPAALPCSTAELARAAGSEPPTEHGRTASRRDQRRLPPRGRPCCPARRRCSPPRNSMRPAVLACVRWHLTAPLKQQHQQAFKPAVPPLRASSMLQLPCTLPELAHTAVASVELDSTVRDLDSGGTNIDLSMKGRLRSGGPCVHRRGRRAARNPFEGEAMGWG